MPGPNSFFIFINVNLSIIYLWSLTFAVLFYVYCYVSINQGKYLFCENLLDNKPDSDSGEADILNVYSTLIYASTDKVMLSCWNRVISFNGLDVWQLDGVDIETYWSSCQSGGCPGQNSKGGWSKKENKCFPLKIMPEERRSTLNTDWSGCSSIDFRLGWAAGQTRPLVLTVWPLID